MLTYRDVGEGPPVVVLHGLFGSARNWTTAAKQLAQSHRVVAVDLRNHGASPWAEPMTYAAMAEDVRAFMAAHGLEGAAVIGHSMGGKAAMVLALTWPDMVGRLVVVDIAPVAYAHAFLGYAHAMRAVDLAQVTRRAQADRALAEAVPEPGVRAFLLQNLVEKDGALAWQVNLDAIIRFMPDLTGFPALAATYDGPTLFVAGGRSDYVTPAHHAAIAARFPQARIATIADAGHWVHAEQPQPFLALVKDFLS